MTTTIVRALTGAERNRYLGAGAGGRPGLGRIVTLWHVAGQWRVWSDGPRRGTWWLTAHDDDAREVLAQLVAGASGTPVIVGEWRTPRTHAIAVTGREIRPAIVGEGA